MSTKPFKNFSHVSLCVTDLEKSRQFYCDALGLEELDRPDFGFPGAWFRLAGEFQLHLTVEPETVPPSERRRRFTPKDPHFALWTDNADETVRTLGKGGLGFDELPQSPTGLRQLFVKDPDGNMIEFIGPSPSLSRRTE